MSLGAAWGTSHLQVTSCNDSNVLVLPQSSATSHEIPKGARWNAGLPQGQSWVTLLNWRRVPSFGSGRPGSPPRTRGLEASLRRQIKQAKRSRPSTVAPGAAAPSLELCKPVVACTPLSPARTRADLSGKVWAPKCACLVG